MKATRPKARPTAAPKKSTRPKSRADGNAEGAVKRGDRAAKREAYDQDTLSKKKAGGKMPPKKMAKGGMTRGCGAATKGKRYTRAG